MTYCRETLIVKRISFRSLNVSRLTFYEQRDYSQAGC
jgi:hypothetical protein